MFSKQVTIAEGDLKVVVALLKQKHTRDFNTSQAATDVGIERGALEKRLERFLTRYKDLNGGATSGVTVAPATTAATPEKEATPKGKTVAKATIPKKRKVEEVEEVEDLKDDEE